VVLGDRGDRQRLGVRRREANPLPGRRDLPASQPPPVDRAGDRGVELIDHVHLALGGVDGDVQVALRVGGVGQGPMPAIRDGVAAHHDEPDRGTAAADVVPEVLLGHELGVALRRQPGTTQRQATTDDLVHRFDSVG
jgi:hypothetical protein